MVVKQTLQHVMVYDDTNSEFCDIMQGEGQKAEQNGKLRECLRGTRRNTESPSSASLDHTHSRACMLQPVKTRSSRPAWPSSAARLCSPPNNLPSSEYQGGNQTQHDDNGDPGRLPEPTFMRMRLVAETKVLMC